MVEVGREEEEQAQEEEEEEEEEWEEEEEKEEQSELLFRLQEPLACSRKRPAARALRAQVQRERGGCNRWGRYSRCSCRR